MVNPNYWDWPRPDTDKKRTFSNYGNDTQGKTRHFLFSSTEF